MTTSRPGDRPAARRPAGTFGAVRLPFVRGRLVTSAALGFLLIALLPALEPLVRPGTPATNDAAYHLQRIMALHLLARDGGTLSRWLPDVAYGYGAPVFNYYAPLAYLPAVALSLLGVGYVASLELTVGLALAASALAMYGLAQSLFGRAAALTAALVYAYLPYQLFDLYLRGAIAESAAFAWLPVACWCLVRLRAGGRRRWAVGLAVAIGGLVLTHQTTALLAMPALVALAATLWLAPAPGAAIGRRAYLGQAAAAFATGLGLAAWYWVPALFERGLAQLEAALIAPATFATYFIREWPPLWTDFAYDYLRDPRPGLTQVAISAGGAAATLRASGLTRWTLGWATGLTAAAWILQLGVAVPLFQLLPLLQFIQFPFRFLTLMGLGSALLAAGLVQAAPRHPSVRLLVAGAVIGLAVWSGLARLAPEHSFPDDRYITPEGAIRAEQANVGLATAVFGEFLPSLPGGPPTFDRLRREVLGSDPPRGGGRPRPPVAYRVDRLEWGPLSLRARIAAPEPDRLLVHQFFFPGWTARVDGRPAALGPDGRYGIMGVDVPAGVHDVELSFELTGVRFGGLVATGFALLALGLLAFTRDRPGGWLAWRQSTLARAAVVSVLAVGAILGAAVPGERASSGGSLTRWDEVDGQVAVVGSRLDRSRLPREGLLGVRLEWLSLTAQRDPYVATVQVTSAAGTTREASWAHALAMRFWERGELVRTETDLRLPADFPIGPARVTLRLERRDGTSRPEPPLIELGELEIVQRRAADTGPRFAIVVNRALAEQAELVSYELRGAGVLGRHELRPGEPLDANLAWLLRGPSSHEVGALLQLRGPRGEAASERQIVGLWFHPPHGWQAGDHLGQQVRLVLPRDLPPDAYDVWLRVSARDRSWIGPSVVTGRPGGSRPDGELLLGRIVVRP